MAKEDNAVKTEIQDGASCIKNEIDAANDSLDEGAPNENPGNGGQDVGIKEHEKTENNLEITTNENTNSTERVEQAAG